MSAKSEFSSAIWDMITSDSVILAELGTSEVNLFASMASRDCAMPYGVYSIRWGVDYGQMHRGQLSIDWWDYADSSDRIEQVAGATKTLLADSMVTLGGDYAAGRCYSPSEENVPTDQEKVWRYQMIFPCRAFDRDTAEALISRSIGGN